MKMKINNFEITKIIILFIFCLQPSINFKLRLTGHNSYDSKSKEQDSGYESPDLHHSAADWDSQDDAEMSNLEIRNQIYSHNLEPIMRTYDSDTRSSSSSSSSSSSDNSNQKYSNNSNDNSPKFISRMINSHPPLHQPPPFRMGSCPCAAFVKCQPCGLIPDLDFFHRNIECPCAPKLNCPACPPLSLIHEIAAKKVIYIFK